MSDVKPPLFFGILLTLLGAVMIFGSLSLMKTAGVDLYFLSIGLGVTCSGILIAIGKKVGAYLYALTLAVIIIWSIIEVGGNSALLPRIFMPIVFGLYIFSDKIQSRLS